MGPAGGGAPPLEEEAGAAAAAGGEEAEARPHEGSPGPQPCPVAPAAPFEPCGSDASSAPPDPTDWNSDDEPPQDHEGDEHVCSRDGAVKKIIRRVGRGLERPGQYDLVRLRYEILPPEGGTGKAPDGTGWPERAVVEEVEVRMGEDQLPLAVEFVVKCMRIGEISEVVGPAKYAVNASPLCGRKLRTVSGRLPQMGKVPRKMRFLPAAPPELANQVGALRRPSPEDAKVEGEEAAGASTAPSQERRPPPFRARVELVGIDVVEMLTEDRSISKHILRHGGGRRKPRLGDIVTFSMLLHGGEGRCERHTLLLGDKPPPFEGLEHVLQSMKAGERCVARLPRRPPVTAPAAADAEVVGAEGAGEGGATGGASRASGVAGGAGPAGGIPDAILGAAPEEIRLIVAMHHVRRHDAVAVSIDGAGERSATARDGKAGCLELSKLELRAGPDSLVYDIEDGSLVLVGVAARTGATAEAEPCLLTWCLGEGAVPGYMEAAVRSMRLTESAVFDASEEVVASIPVGPSYEGQTPLRRVVLPEFDPLAAALLHDRHADAAALPLVEEVDDEGDVDDAPPLPDDRPSGGWMTAGQPMPWEQLGLERATGSGATASFRLALLAATEAADVCVMNDEGQREYLERDRARGNALARLGRFAEASVAYGKALDAVRRTPLYKALFPTERGRIEGAYTRDPAESEHPLERLEPGDVEAWRTRLVALHLNLALCAVKEGRLADARRHSTTVLGAEPDNAKALFRRGSAAMSADDYEKALPDLQRAAELQPQDRTIRAELQTLQQRIKEHREAQKIMFQHVFRPPCRKDQDTQRQEPAQKLEHGGPQAGQEGSQQETKGEQPAEEPPEQEAPKPACDAQGESHQATQREPPAEKQLDKEPRASQDG